MEAIVFACLASRFWFRALIFLQVHAGRYRQDSRFRIDPLCKQRGLRNYVGNGQTASGLALEVSIAIHAYS